MTTSDVVAHLELGERPEILGESEPPAGPRGGVPGREVRPPPSPVKLKAIFVFGCSKGWAIFHFTSKLLIANKSRLQRWCWRAVTLFLDFSFLCRPIWGNVTVLPFPLVLPCPDSICSPNNIWGNGVPPRSPSTTPLTTMTACHRVPTPSVVVSDLSDLSSV